MCLCKLVSQCRHIGIYTLTNQIQGNIQVFIFNFIISLIYGFCIIQQDFRITDKREIISLLRIGYHTFSTPFLVAITCTGSWIIDFGCFKIRLIPLPRSSANGRIYSPNSGYPVSATYNAYDYRDSKIQRPFYHTSGSAPISQ